MSLEIQFLIVKIHKDGSVLIEDRERTQITINIWSDYFKVKFCKVL